MVRPSLYLAGFSKSCHRLLIEVKSYPTTPLADHQASSISYEMPAAELSICWGYSFPWNLLDPMDSSTLHPKAVILSSYLCPTDVTPEVDPCPEWQLSNTQLSEFCLQGQLQPCSGGLFAHEVSKFRASVKRDACEEWWSLSKLGSVTYQVLTKSENIKKQTNQVQIYNKADRKSVV